MATGRSDEAVQPSASRPAASRTPATDGERVTIAMVAAQAGVSIPTVSKVLNGRDHVGTATRTRVQQALERTGYRRRGRARPARTGLVTLLISTVETPWARALLTGAEQEAYRLGAALVLGVTHDDRGRPRDPMWTAAARPTDGVVLVVSHPARTAVDRLRPAGTPLVVIDRLGGHDGDVPTIGASNYAGGLTATAHLIALGHRRIGVITGPDDLPCGRERLDGHRAALARAGLDADPHLVRTGDLTADGGHRAAAGLLDTGDPPTAVLACGEFQARGVYEAAHRRGLRVPDDLSVVGFDDVDPSAWLAPPLTTVRQPHAQMAALAVRHVLEPGPCASEQPLRLEVSTSLVVRDSTAALAARDRGGRPGR